MGDLTNNERQMLTRWRLVLGRDAEQHGICIGAGDEQARRIEARWGICSLRAAAMPRAVEGTRGRPGRGTR